MAEILNKSLRVIAGPCSAESREQMLATARALRELGITEFRAGLWKPRTKPGGFEGWGAKALPWLREVKDDTGMRVATEVATAEHAESCLKAGIDILWVGARTAADPFALDGIAATLQGSDVEVLVKNPPYPDIEAWIGAIQRIERSGIRKISAVLRGFGMYGETYYRNAPCWPVAIELRRRLPGINVIVDPSHIAGRSSLVSEVSRQALDMGFNALMIECHNSPVQALSDAGQQLTPCELNSMLSTLVLRNSEVSQIGLESLRQEIDAVDSELIDLIARRMEIARRIGELKADADMSVVQPKRYERLLQAAIAMGEKKGLSVDTVSKIMYALHEESVRQQLSCQK